ncbi:hypothetical protein PPYR_05784 [Photinus pyralis]|uniref:Protein kinase domain-containing protein n=1 Tax=Photinus pyralis TaxID=7054 RepID=A0A1Y1NHC6_PHOPY|nr:membrane-associated tyrosine- and threonine-specific cdc2-inhibitory kinase [Photinus pyralis]KAB0801430.1 hypothetical protein PPYR_05784 [Photinus pyralis]
MAKSKFQKKHKLIFIKTKKKQRIKQASRSTRCSIEDIPIKVRHSLHRRRSNAPVGAVAMVTSPNVVLSSLYRRDADLKYMDQVFTSKVEIGRGSFGNVYKVMSRDDHNQYAVKVTNDKRSVVHKGEASRMLKFPPHQHCIQLVNAWEEDFRIHIQMELCKISLEAFLNVHYSVPERPAMEIFLDIALGLQHLHAHGLIHLDIKPSNIMITETGICKLGDFGLLVDTRDLRNDKVVSSDPSEGDSKYVAMEVLRQEIYTKAADIFSFGLLMMETLSDVNLPKGGPVWELLRLGREPTCYHNRSVSNRLRSLLRKMMRVDYKNRPQIGEILQHVLVRNVMIARENGNRINIMATWEADLAMHLVNLQRAVERAAQREQQRAARALVPEPLGNLPPPLHEPMEVGQLPASPRVPLQEMPVREVQIMQQPVVNPKSHIVRRLF